MQIVRTQKEVDRIIDWTDEAFEQSNVSWKFYEDGVREMHDWLIGLTNEAPDDAMRLYTVTYKQFTKYTTRTRLKPCVASSPKEAIKKVQADLKMGGVDWFGMRVAGERDEKENGNHQGD